ncbi:Q-cell neuroblast polarization protein, partial [Toxoplasma gondii ARI]
KTNVPPDAAILGDMPSSSTLRAATQLRLVIHPQFEQAEMRKRVQFLYGASACPPEELYASLMQRVYETDYLLINNFRCAAAKQNKVTVFGVADLVEEKSFPCPRAVESFSRFCFKTQLSSASFDLLYRNGVYAVLKVKEPRGTRAEGKAATRSQSDRKEAEKQLKESLRVLDIQKKNEAYLSFDWKSKVSTLEALDPWIQRCITDDERCGRNMQEFAQELMDLYGLKVTSRLLQEKSVSLFPDHSDVLFGHGVFLDFDMGNSKDAATYYERGADKDPLSVAKTVQFLLFLDQAIGRSRAVESVNRLLHLEDILEKKTNAELLDDATNLCKAALLLKQLVDTQVKQGASRDTPHAIQEQERVMQRIWDRSKELNIQNECVVEGWAYFENSRLTTARRIQHFFFGESRFLSRVIRAVSLFINTLLLS